MPLDVRTERWIKSSIEKHFDDGKSPYILIFEGDVAPTDLDGWCEIRLNGPRYSEVSKDFYVAELEINLAMHIKLGPNQNLYRGQEMAGHFRSLCESQIEILKLKDTDPAELINCLRLRDNVPNPIEVTPWGEIGVGGTATPLKVFLTTIDSYYKLEIDQ